MVKRKRASTRKKTIPPAQTHASVSSRPLRASVARRFAGFFLDYLILGIPNSVVLWALKDNGLYTPIATAYNIFFALVVFGYFIFLTWKNNGQTLGKQIVGTRVVSWRGSPRGLTSGRALSASTSRGKLQPSKIVVRYLVLFFLVQFPAIYKLLSGTDLGIGLLLLNVLVILLVGILLIIDDEHRGVHDFVADTWVVRTSGK